jgi:hypothetical protein
VLDRDAYFGFAVIGPGGMPVHWFARRTVRERVSWNLRRLEVNA